MSSSGGESWSSSESQSFAPPRLRSHRYLSSSEHSEDDSGSNSGTNITETYGMKSLGCATNSEQLECVDLNQPCSSRHMAYLSSSNVISYVTHCDTTSKRTPVGTQNAISNVNTFNSSGNENNLCTEVHRLTCTCM